MTKQPIAIVHVFYRAIGHLAYEADSDLCLSGYVMIARMFDTPWFIEWLGQHNGREVINCERGE